jgi:hypothetical protein
MDDIENIEAQISYLQEDIGQRLQLLNDSQSTGQFKQSTPKPVDSETERSDSGIVIGQQSTPHGGARPKITKMPVHFTHAPITGPTCAFCARTYCHFNLCVLRTYLLLVQPVRFDARTYY